MPNLQRTTLHLTPALTPAVHGPAEGTVRSVALWTRNADGHASVSPTTWCPHEAAQAREVLAGQLGHLDQQDTLQAGVAQLGEAGEVLGIDVLYSRADALPLKVAGIHADLTPCPPVLLLHQDAAGQWQASPLDPHDAPLPEHDRIGVWCETPDAEGLLSTACGDTFVFPASDDGEHDAGGYLDNYARADGPLQHFALRAGLCGLNALDQIVWVKVLYATPPAGSDLPQTRAAYVPRW